MEAVLGKRTRRVVTGHDKDGRAVVLMDGAAPNLRVREATGFVSTLLWVTDGTPADLSGTADGADREIGVAPPENGSIFRTVEFPPLPGDETVDTEEMIAEMRLPKETAGKRHALMHRTRSIDYAIVLSGEISLLLDEETIELQTGDTVVQRGTNHAWVNTGTEPCRMVFILIDAQEPPELDQS